VHSLLTPLDLIAFADESRMAFPQKKAVILPLSQERRRYQRVRVNLLGRYMLADRREFPCQVTDMSPGGMALIAPYAGQLGERVIAYVDHVGRLEGKVTRHFQNGFAMTIATTPRKRDKLAAQLTWLANRHILNLPEDRRHGRITPANPAARLILPNGINIAVRVIDISQSGAAIATDQRPEIGTLVTIGKTAGRVVRHIEDGFAVEFVRLQHSDFLEENVTGW
jgi:PilZ domain